MKKTAISLILVLILLAFSQLACSLGDLLGAGSEDLFSQTPQESGASDSQAPDGEDGNQNPPSDGSSSPGSPGSSCVNLFSGSSNIPDGAEYQAGDLIEASITLTNAGDCVWDGAYSLVLVGGDLPPSSETLLIPSEVSPGESVMVEVEFGAPSQEGVYLSVWKMSDGQGGVFGMENPQDAPLRIKIRVVPSGSPQPTPNPTQNPQAAGDQYTMLADECFDFNAGSVVDCSDGSADLLYNPDHPVFGELTSTSDNTFGEHHTSEPDLTTCQADSYAPMPHFIQQYQYLCFRIETLASTTYGWMRVTNFNDDGLTFEFDLIGSETPLVTAVPNTNLFVESQGSQITLLEGECYDVWNGQKNSGCSGIFAGFLFEEVSKKSLQVAQISPNELQFSAAMTSKPSKTDCMNASYSTSSIWPIQETSYYCYQFVPGSGAYYGWLRPTSFNLSGMTFDYLTWEITQ